MKLEDVKRHKRGLEVPSGGGVHGFLTVTHCRDSKVMSWSNPVARTRATSQSPAEVRTGAPPCRPGGKSRGQHCAHLLSLELESLVVTMVFTYRVLRLHFHPHG